MVDASAELTRKGCPSGLAPTSPPLTSADPQAFVRRNAGAYTLDLLVDGARCAACISKVERAVLALQGVSVARLNLSTGRLHVAWSGSATDARHVAAAVVNAGYRATPFDPAEGLAQDDVQGRRLLRALAVAGFGAMNIMMFSVPIWTGDQDMGAATRTLMHQWSALIAVPAALYAAQPFFGSALRALRKGRANMDVPISLAVILTLAMSLYETATGGARAYFDGVCMLLFLLLIGRYLDHLLRQKARTAARDLLAMQAATASRLTPSGDLESVAASQLAVDDRIMLAAGDRAAVDGVIMESASEFDCALLTGETVPVAMGPGEVVRAGAINLTRPVTLRVTAASEDGLVAQLARLIEIGEQGRAQFVRIADKAAALYVPVVHTLAALTLLGWLVAPIMLHTAPIGFHGALTNAIAVLIITCPCALGLATPAVQVVATGRLFQQGILVKSGDGLERLAKIDTVVFDKTGTLTRGKPRLASSLDEETLRAAASLARASRHPLSRALVDAAGPGAPAANIEEHAGMGIAGVVDGAPARLGRREFAAPDATASSDPHSELWFARAGDTPVRIAFEDALRDDAALVVAALKHRGLDVQLLSGDHAAAVDYAARGAGIANWLAHVDPVAKFEHIKEMRRAGRRVLMVGDGLNDAAALAAAYASAAPGAATEIAQSAADVVFTGKDLAPLVDLIDTARAAQRRVLENLAFSALYNVIAIPVAICGLVTPLLAALAMSGSSLAVTLNALRLQGMRRWTSSPT